MRNAYLKTLCALAERDKNVLALISDNGAIVYDEYRSKYPRQYLNCGISEANMISVAAGLARSGKIPFAYTIIPFLTMRAYEQIKNDICLQNLNVKLVGIGAGCVYSTLGPTHHAIEDIAIMRILPNLTLFSPSTPSEAESCARAAYEIDGPVYIRLGTRGEKELPADKSAKFEASKAQILTQGGDVTIIATGSVLHDALAAADKLRTADGIAAQVINVHTIKPLDEERIINACKKARAVITVEEHLISGGMGSAVCEVIAGAGLGVKVHRMGFTDFVSGYGSHGEVKELNGLSADKIYVKAKEALPHEVD